MHGSFRLAFIGDVVGKPGRQAIKSRLNEIVRKHDTLFVIANAENSANGFGITERVVDELFSFGIDVLTLGNHTWDKKEGEMCVVNEPYIVRPANFSPYAPGKGHVFIEKQGVKLAVLNLIGRVFMDHNESPFLAAERIVPELLKQTPCIFVDFHAEATSEKKAMGFFLDGKISAIAGTHTHVQTADECLLRNNTAYITDVGMTGSYDSIIGNRPSDVLDRFLKGMPKKLEVATEDIRIAYVIVEIDASSGRAASIQRFTDKASGEDYENAV